MLIKYICKQLKTNNSYTEIMIKIFTTGKVRELDQYTIKNEPINSIDLVERAAAAFAQEFTRRYSKQDRIIVFAGFGNNGADALAIARMLLDDGYRVETFLFTGKKCLSAECLENKHRLLEMERVEFTEVTADFDAPELGETDVVIDGLFGSGLNKPLEGGFAAVVDYINESPARVVSIDMPSGLYGEDNSGNNARAIIRATLTLTFAFPKLSFFFPENEPFVGEWKVIDIGMHEDGIARTPTTCSQITEEDINATLRPRPRFAHKGTFGHALLIAGSRGKMGAAVLSAKACLRSGTGLLTVHVPRRCEQILQTAFPEAMLSFDSGDDFFTSVPDLPAFSAIGAGPGLGQRTESKRALRQLLQAAKAPMVLDADALNMIASDKELLPMIPPHTILTPHPKEFDRLAGDSATSYERLQKATAFATEHKVCVILKSAYTAVCTPGGNIYFNSTGNPGMATAGSGDVLTGILLGLLAQGYDPQTAAAIGVFIHGSAGDMASHFQSEESMIAGDIIEMLGKAFRQVR